MKRMKWLKIKTPKDGLHDFLKVIIERGVAIFSIAFSGHPARKISKNHATAKMPSAAPFRPNKGSKHRYAMT